MNRVMVSMQGVHFGKNYWVSHETITGCEAKLIPQEHPQYWEWVLNANPNIPSKMSKETALIDSITLRDLFAAAALQGMIKPSARNLDRNHLAIDAYFYADGMLMERDK